MVEPPAFFCVPLYQEGGMLPCVCAAVTQEDCSSAAAMGERLLVAVQLDCVTQV
jgi:hypothetical protein